MNKKQKNKQHKVAKRVNKELHQKKYPDVYYSERPSPFSEIKQEDLIRLYADIASTHEDLYSSCLEKLEGIVLRFDPMLLLCYMSFYFLTQLEGEDRELTDDKPVLQHHLEFLQGYIFRQQPSSFLGNPIKPQQIKELCDILFDLSRAFMFKRIGKLTDVSSREELNRLFILDVVRSHTLAVRNWAYEDQMIRITKELFSPIEEEFKKEFGLGISNTIDMLLRIIRISEKRLNEHRKTLRQVLREKQFSSMLNKFFGIFATGDDLSEQDLRAAIEDLGLNVDQLRYFLIHLSDTLLTNIYSFRLIDFAEAYGSPVDQHKIVDLLDRLSLKLGDLSEYDVEHLFLNNPVWHRPIIHRGEDDYVWPLLTVFISFCLVIFENLISSSVTMKSKYEKHRSAYLENSVADLFGNAFPTAQMYRGSIWRDMTENKQYENDLAVLVDTHLIIVEAKSGRITSSALRGGERRLENTIDKLVTEPSRQISRFLAQVMGTPGVHKFPTRSGRDNVIDTGGVKHVIRLSLTLATMNMVGVSWYSLKEAGYIPSDVDLTPVIGLSDLETIFDILESECEKLHYLTRRSELEDHTIYIGEEIDLLGFYRDTGFNIGEAEFNNKPIFIGMLSKTFDNYYLRMSNGQSAIKPRCKRSKWWESILAKLEDRKPEHWTDMGMFLLNIPFEEQVTVEREFKRIQQNVRLHWQEPNHLNHIVLVTGPEQRKSVLVAVAYKSIPKRERDELIRGYVSSAAGDSGVTNAFVIGMDVDKGDYPYSLFGYLGTPTSE